MSLPYFLPIILYGFSSKYAMVRVAYVVAILVPTSGYSYWTEGAIIKDYFYILSDKFLLNLGCNVV